MDLNHKRHRGGHFDASDDATANDQVREQCQSERDNAESAEMDHRVTCVKASRECLFIGFIAGLGL